ncbi:MULTISPECIES: hypothetical protein [Streptomyces]|uniref:Uncharacterized protein n=1 Tax=Streptomyces luteosporeus TaxID=173856 RepID=A0ABP6G4F4_9ACTN
MSSNASPAVSVHRIETPNGDAWVAWDDQRDTDYAYGGSRMVPSGTPDEEAVSVLRRLAVGESKLKNTLINTAFEEGVLDGFSDRFPQGFLQSRVGGGRCIIRPRDAGIENILSDPLSPEFRRTIEPIFAGIGAFLNEMDGRIKLTPDFGRFAGLADLLLEHTPHVLGVRREVGGCGGKSSFSTTGVIAAFEELKPAPAGPVTLIGSDGAMGSDFFDYLKRSDLPDVAVADIAYAAGTTVRDGYPVLPSRPGTFTTECLGRGGSVVANTWGNELENADVDALRPGTLLLLAHNHSVPEGQAGLDLMRRVAGRDVLALPGQVLTLGGALTSRLEWFSRQARPGELFDKPLAHDVVRTVIRYWVRRCVDSAGADGTTPYEAMLSAA